MKMENTFKNPVIYWNKKVPNTELQRFQKIVEEKYNLKFNSYWELHKWTVLNYPKFWEELWHFFGVIASKSYSKVFVKTGRGFLDNEWFSGAKLNYAENILQIRDSRVALISLDEFGNEETVTYAEVYEEVKLYSAAFRKNGLRTGDTVASFLPNRKEAIYAYLATASIGAIWGSILPFYGARAASKMIQHVDPKFLITIDNHEKNGIVYRTLEILPEIVDNSPCIEKVILIATRDDTRKKDLSSIRNCVFLEDFLDEGRTRDGRVPEIIFEQLSFDHPLCINFTSGTSDSPKAFVHSAGTFISLLGDIGIAKNAKSGEVFCLNFVVGWSLWDKIIPSLRFGVTLFLYCGMLNQTIQGINFWDLLSKYNVNMVLLNTCDVDKMEKMKLFPSPGTDMTSLKKVFIGGNPAKKENFKYLLTCVNKDLFIGNRYGATEVFGTFSGCDFNMPTYGTEIQVPSLGMDVQCFDSEGRSVIGQRGNLVVGTPAIGFPVALWKDVNSKKIRELYLETFPGVWAQSDECWINPETKGILVIGRRDGSIKQNDCSVASSAIYSAIHSMDELEDYLCVSQKKKNGYNGAVLFVKMRSGVSLTSEMRSRIEKKVSEELWEKIVPELILEVSDIPYSFNSKKLESVVLKILETNSIPKEIDVRNPESLKNFINIPEILMNDE